MEDSVFLAWSGGEDDKGAFVPAAPLPLLVSEDRAWQPWPGQCCLHGQATKEQQRRPNPLPLPGWNGVEHSSADGNCHLREASGSPRNEEPSRLQSLSFRGPVSPRAQGRETAHGHLSCSAASQTAPKPRGRLGGGRGEWIVPF